MLAYLLIFLVFAKAERQTQRMRRLIRALSAAQIEQDQLGDHAGGILVVIPAYNEAEALPERPRRGPGDRGRAGDAHPRRRRRLARRRPVAWRSSTAPTS